MIEAAPALPHPLMLAYDQLIGVLSGSTSDAVASTNTIVFCWSLARRARAEGAEHVYVDRLLVTCLWTLINVCLPKLWEASRQAQGEQAADLTTRIIDTEAIAKAWRASPDLEQYLALIDAKIPDWPPRAATCS